MNVKILTAIAAAVVGTSAVADVREPYLVLDDSCVTHPWNRKTLRESWRQEGDSYVRKLAVIPQGRLEFRTVFATPGGAPVKVEFLDADRQPVWSDSAKAGEYRVAFDVTKPIAYLRVTPGKSALAWEVMPRHLRITVDQALFETFDFSPLGRLPDGWTANGAAITNHMASAGAWDAKGVGSDPFLAVGPGGTAEVRFAPDKGKYAVSFQTYAHERSVLWVTLPNGRKVSFRGIDFVFSEEPEPRLRYRAALGVWYTLRFEIDPAAGKTVVKLNGRELGTIPGGGANGGRLVFANTGTIASCVDDVKVRALVDHADGVPEPVVPRDSKGNVVGMNICSLWHEGSHLGWDCVARCDAPKPVLGFYDEGEGESADWEIKYMVEHGIDFQAFCWYADTWTGPLKHPSLAYQLDDGFKNAKWSSKMSYCLIWECANASIPYNFDVWKTYYVPYFIEHHFKDPRYLKIKNRIPLFAFAGSWKVAKQFGGVEKMREAFDYLEAEVRKLGYDGMIYVLSHDRSKADYAKMGYDATAAYNWGGSAWRFDVNTNCNWRNAQDRSCFTIPTISVGFNNEAWGGKRKPMMTPADFEKSLKWARDEFGPATAAKGTWQEGLYLISTWNEYGEGTYIVPTKDARGFGYLDAVRSVFTDERPDPRLNLEPTPQQLRRINRMFRDEPVAVWDTPAKLAAWTKWTCQVEKAEVKDGLLRVVCNGGDGQVYSDDFSLKAKPGQEFVFRARTKAGGRGEIFWMKPGKAATQKLSTGFEWIGDGQWHEYRVRPFWQGEGTIGRIRLDFASSASRGDPVEISSIRVESRAAVLDISAEACSGVAFDLQAPSGGLGAFAWAADDVSGREKVRFRYAGDGRTHTYLLNLEENPRWKGMIAWTNLAVDAGVSVRNLRFVSGDAQLPADLVIESARAEDAFNRVGSSVPVKVLVRNYGTETARGATVRVSGLPAGVRLVNAAALAKGADVYGLEAQAFTLEFAAERPCAFTAKVAVAAAGARGAEVDVPVKVLPSLNLPRSAYVPEPKPAKTDYDIAALYFPGWCRVQAWERVWNRCPERKPVLGWYDEANPEVVDWQIKWLVENGIRTLYVDWYWHKGSISLDHWVKAFYRAKYRKYLKWAMMWANHTPPGAHSVEDQRAVTKYWIEHYFNTPEYLQIDGKPVVWYWQADNMNRDLGEGGCRKLLDLSRQMAVEAGFKGIHFIAMKWPEADGSAAVQRHYRDLGFDMTGIYHFMSHGGRCDSNSRFPFSAVADANPENWWKQHEAKVLPFIPNLSTGWDDRPWNDHCEIYGKNAADFRRICVEAKKFADKTGVKRLCLSPLNEWGEGSYAEPNAEHGFGFYEAVRDVFCEKPAEGWPLNYGPKDVGLGPYDLPPPAAPRRVTSWTFTDGAAHGWSALMGIENLKPSPHGLAFKTNTADPALVTHFAPVFARDFREVVVRLKTTERSGSLQLFWMHPGGEARESSSVAVPIVADGQMHEYVLPVATRSTWRGRIGGLRFDTGNASGASLVVESIKMR